MARITVEDCLDKVENRFSLVVLVAKRAKQLIKGARPTVASKNKAVVSALREVSSGHTSFNQEAEIHGEARLQIESDLNR